jgi:tetratricopeptide (TPR) repeat protein
LVNRGAALSNESKYEEAVKAYDEAIKLDPDFADAWYKKGVALKNRGKYDETIMAYDECHPAKSQRCLCLAQQGLGSLCYGQVR